VRAPWRSGEQLGDDQATMDADRARSLAEHAHAADRDADGASVLAHVARVVLATPTDAHAIAWLHEVLERGALTEHELLAAGVSSDELHALRLVTPPVWARSDRAYLGHVELIAAAAGRPGRLARAVKAADLRDGCAHPRTIDGWSPPCAAGLQRLGAARDDRRLSAPVAPVAPGAPVVPLNQAGAG
jgi:hypothetical protein